MTAWLLGPVAILLAVSLLTPGAGAADPIAGSQGTDTSLPATESAVTVNGRGVFANLAITVNQTADLNNQAVSITWIGGAPTVQGPGRFGSQFVQIMQCWGDDDGSVEGSPGPPPEQCLQGAASGVFGGSSSSALPGGFATSRVISRPSWPGYKADVGFLESTGNVWRPFRAVNGTVVNSHTDPAFNPSVVGGNYWLNPFFNVITTNEIAGAATGLDGKGAELFEVQTGIQSSGLGCGQKVEPIASGEKKVPRCWIVIVPRGEAAAENVGTPFEDRSEQYGVYTSPLSPAAWQNRIAIPIDFNPVDSTCSLADEERRLAGSDLALTAIASWQPILCASADLPPYSYAPVSDGSARQQLSQGAQGSPGMVVVSRPLTMTDPARPVVYAPLTASGLAIGFNIERSLKPEAPAEEQRIAGVRFADLNLTPRLVAKLLTQSYRQQVTILQAPTYTWTEANPGHLGVDPDFLQFNPEFNFIEIADGRTFSGLQLPAGNSDAAQQVWEWILADPEAAQWMGGVPDEWGMTVNPVYATTPAANSNGFAFADPIPNSFPKGDPYCYQGPTRNGVVPPPLCGTDWMPYARSLADAARIGRAAFDGARIVENPFAASAGGVWSREVPQLIGRRAMLVMTDTPSAAQFGVQTARLSRAGDKGADRRFIAADTAGLTAGAAAMKAGAEPTVLEPRPTEAPSGAYPLTALTYAAITPLSLDAQARTEYAAFVEYAVGPGQSPGLELGQLPRGYAPLSTDLQVQALTAANQIRSLVPAPVPEVPVTTTTVPVVIPQQPSSQVTPARTTVRNTTNASPQPAPVAAPPTTEVADTTPSTATPPSLVPTTIDQADEPAAAPPTILTPFVGMARSRYAVPGIGALAFGSAWGVMEISRRPRRRQTVDGDLDLLINPETP